MAHLYSPRSVVGDGNCFFRAVSLALYGTDKYHGYLRVLTALEFITNSSAYSCASPNFVLRNLPILTPHYKQLLRETVTDKSESEMIHLFGLSKAVGIPLQKTECTIQLNISASYASIAELHVLSDCLTLYRPMFYEYIDLQVYFRSHLYFFRRSLVLLSFRGLIIQCNNILWAYCRDNL